jgi:AraC-like DNA-binding protein
MSTRHFALVFAQDASMTPYGFVESARVDVARFRLESNIASQKSIAYECGCGTANQMRVVFNRHLGYLRMNTAAIFAASDTFPYLIEMNNANDNPSWLADSWLGTSTPRHSALAVSSGQLESPPAP